MNKNTYTVLCLMILSVVVAFSGTHYWDDGEIVRGPKINVALDEKLDQSGATFFQLEPTGTFATAGADIGTVFHNRGREARAELVHAPVAGWKGAFGLQASDRDFVAVGAEAFVPGSVSRDTGLFWIGQRAFGPLQLDLGLRHDRNRASEEVNRLKKAGQDASELINRVRGDAERVKELEGRLLGQGAHHAAQLPDDLEFIGRNQDLFTASTRGVDVDGREDALIGQAAR